MASSSAMTPKQGRHEFVLGQQPSVLLPLLGAGQISEL